MSIARSQAEALRFHLQHAGALARLQSLPAFAHADPDTTMLILEQAAAFAGDVLAPLAASGDLQACALEQGRVRLPSGTPETWHHWCSLGFPALGLPAEFGGLAFPRVVQCAVQEICDGANLAFGMLAINLRCAALALLGNADAAAIARWVPGLASGELTSTIVISEAQAGSDVGRISTSAQAAGDGTWRISGGKLWISYGDHDASEHILHLVLARVPGGESGTRGLGLFAVPSRRDDGSANGISVLRLEHKMGLHASPTCVLDFHAAQGWLVGEAGRGLQALFVMMNAMRLAVAVQGAAAANAATLHALDYALTRPQGGPAQAPPVMISEHADVRRMLFEMCAQAELARALALRTASLLDLAEGSHGEEARRWQGLGEFLLPLAKTLNAESGFAVANQGIQVLGGYGYTSDYPLERLARDIRVASIYEGTSGIQALDFLKRKLLADKGATLRELLALVAADLQAGSSPFNAALAGLLARWEALAQRLVNTEAPPDAGAYALLQLAGCLVHGWNGHVLFLAAGADTEYQRRLRAALELFAVALPGQAELWAAKAACPLPAYRFTAP